ncbi:hypothetical protein EJ03DRAFT_134565 [Teratosphaeria nubilosa]|uniref:K Homology domain-containing protein n=1 Tax=Teratosphaeria nubilosa TaxID=161662 RepID=A0A6G1L5P7_9PEZI|nr:hypothetical protein EJ03DRAFT_134565 [Teratosphaeria nubilosa]
MAAQPDISQILAALASQQPANGSQAPTPAQPPAQAPPGYPPSAMPAQPPSAPPQPTSYYPPPATSSGFDLSAIKPVNSGSVSIADAIAQAKNIAQAKGVQSYDYKPAQSPREDPRLAGRGDYRRSRSRSPPRRESYGANPYRDERREDPRRRGNYGRSPSPDRNYRGSRDPPPNYRQNDGETETMRVKSALVGLIIGRNGENLRRVESETGARVQFIQANDKHVAERSCTISGNLRARIAARDAITAIIEENGGQNVSQEKGAYTAGMPGRAKVNLPELREGEKSTQIMVPDKTVGLIIGRGGETIKDVQEKSGCHVNIVGENKSVNGLRPVNLIGSDHATAMAKELILEIVESDSRDAGKAGSQQPSRDRGYGNTNNYERGGSAGGRATGDHVEKTIYVPSEAVGMIIGKGGETIKETQRTTGCKINVHQPQRPDIERQIDLSGTARNMEAAERIIWEKVETVRQRDAAGGEGRGGRGRGGNAQAPPMDYGNGGYSQQQQAPPQVPGYGQYAPQAAPQMPAFQMPAAQSQQATPQPGSDGQQADPYAAWGGQAAVAAWYASQMASLGQPGQGGAPGTQ